VKETFRQTYADSLICVGEALGLKSIVGSSAADGILNKKPAPDLPRDGSYYIHKSWRAEAGCSVID
jgi:hypothetical protein